VGVVVVVVICFLLIGLGSEALNRGSAGEGDREDGNYCGLRDVDSYSGWQASKRDAIIQRGRTEGER
jgi:hypothetical protein